MHKNYKNVIRLLMVLFVAIGLNQFTFGQSKIPFQGLSVDHEGVTGWNVKTAGAEAVKTGHTLSQPPASIAWAYYYVGSRDYVGVDSSSKSGMHAIQGVQGFPNLMNALSANGKSINDIKVSFGYMSLGADASGTDWSLVGNVETRNYKGGMFQIKLNNEVLYTGTMPNMTMVIKYYAYQGKTDSISAWTDYVNPSRPTGMSTVATAIANAIDLDVAQRPMRFVFKSMQSANNSSYAVNGREGGYFDIQDGVIELGAAQTTCQANAWANMNTIPSGQCTYLHASGGTSYQWNTQQTADSIQVCPTATTTYTVTVTNAAQQTCSASVVINVNTGSNQCAAAFSFHADSLNNMNMVFNRNTIYQSGDQYTWKFGDGNTSNTMGNTSHLYANNGNYNVCLVINNSLKQCKDSVCQNITVGTTSGGCTINAYSPKPNITIGDSTSIIASGALSYNWSNGAKTATIKVNPSISTVYTVTGTNANQQTCTASVNIIVNAAAQCSANFTFKTDSINKLKYNFTAANTGYTNYFWSFGDGSTGSGASNQHTYTAAGTYTVKLKVMNSTVCSDSSMQTITVNGGTTGGCALTVIPMNPQVQAGSSVMLTASGAMTYKWNNQATTASITVNPTATSTYTVTGTSSTGQTCVTSVVVTVNTAANCSANFTFMTDSLNAMKIKFNAPYISGNQYSWKFGDGTTASVMSTDHIYTAAGSYNVCLKVTNSLNQCTDSICKTVVVQGGTTPCNLNVTATKPNITAGESTTLTANGALSYNWSNGGKTASITVNPTATTVYTVTGTTSTQQTCTASFTITVNTAVSCSADFNFKADSANKFAYSFNPTNANNTTFNWKFGDGSVSNLMNPQHTYTNTGTYTVCLKSWTATGCSDSICKTIVIQGSTNTCNLSVTATKPNITAGESTTITANGALSYNWSNGGNTASITVNPTATTVYTVTGTTSTQQSCTASFTITVNTAVSCSADFNFKADSTNKFAYSFNPTNANNTTFNWKFGDGSVSNLMNPQHTYTNTGTYTVCLKSWTATGCSDSICKTIVIQGSTNTCNLSVTATKPNITAGESTTITANGALSYSWSNGGKTASITVNPTATTVYTVTGTTSTQQTCTASFTVTVNSANTCSANFSFMTDSLNAMKIKFNAPYISGNQYSWKFGDGTTASVMSTDHIYTAAGSYNVCLKVTNSLNQCTDSICKTVVVNQGSTGGCTLNVTPNNTMVQPGTSVTLTASGAMSYKWNNQATTATITVTPTATTTYTVTGTSSTGQTCVFSAVVNVNAGTGCFVNTNSTKSTIKAGETTTLNASGASTYAWSNGSNGASITVSPSATTVYTVTGTNANQQSCTSSITITVIVCNAHAQFSIALDSLNPLKVKLNGNTAVGFNSGYKFGDGTMDSISKKAIQEHVYSQAGTYQVCYFLWNNTCVDSICQNVTVGQTTGGCNLSLTATKTAITAGQSTVLTASGASSYSWNNGAKTATITVSPSTNTVYTVTGTTANNQTCTASITITVNPAITCSADFSFRADSTNKSLLTFTPNNGTYTSYLWKFGDGTVSSLKNPQHAYTSVGSYNVCLRVMNSTVCTDSICKTIVIDQGTTVNCIANAGADLTINAGACATLTANQLANASFAWSTGSTSGSVQTVTVCPTANTTYTLTVTVGSKTCTDQVIVNVNGCQLNVANTKPTIQAGESAVLTANGSATYKWSNNLTTASITVTPTATTTYTVTGTNTNGSTCTASVVVTVQAVSCQALYSFNKLSDNKTVAFNNNSVGLNLNYSWNFGDGSKADTAKNPTHLFANNGKYNVCLTISNKYGCQNTKCDSIFIGTNTSACNVTVAPMSASITAGQNIVINASGVATYAWSNGANTAAITVNPASTTTYSVTGTTANQQTCVAKSIIIVNTATCQLGAWTEMTQIQTGNCTKLHAKGANSYKWSNGSTADSLVVCPTVTTSYTVTGTNTDGNTCTALVVVNVSQPIACFAEFGFKVDSTNNKHVTFNNFSKGSNLKYNWSFGDGSSDTTFAPIHNYANAGDFNVTLTISGDNNCKQQVSRTVHVGVSGPTTCAISLGTGFEIQKGECRTFNVGGITVTGANFVWSTGNTGQTLTVCPTLSTNYTVTATLPSGAQCVAKALVTVRECNAKAQYSFKIDSTNKLRVRLYGNTMTGYKVGWRFGDGGLDSTSQQNVVEHTFANAGAYSVAYYLWNGYCVDSIAQTIKVDANVIPCNVNAGEDLTINQGSCVNILADGAFQYKWSNGMNSKVLSVCPNATTTYVVTATNSTGMSCSDNVVVNVIPANCHAKFDFVIDTVLDRTVKFASTTEAANPNYLWRFGDDSTSVSSNPVHQYAKPGQYNVCVIASNAFCADTVCRTIFIQGITPCNVYASFEGTVNNKTVTFKDSITGAINKMYWNYGDGTYSTSYQSNHTYTNAGVYTVCLDVVGQTATCVSHSCQTFKVGNAPACYADFAYTISGQTVAFTNNSGNYSKVNWNFGNGSISMDINPTFTYTKAGVYEVVLTVFDETTNCQSIKKQLVQIGEAPVYCNADFAFYPTSTTNEFQFKAVGANSSSVKFYWVFGDGSYESVANPVHLFANNGIYKVSLSVYDSSSRCQQQSVKEIVVGANNCNADFNVYVDTTTNKAFLYDASTGGINTWFWSFGNGQTASSQSPVVQYTAPGNYDIVLSVKNTQTGCFSSIKKTITIGQILCDAKFTYYATATGAVSASDSVYFFNQSVGNLTSYNWNFGDGYSSSDVNPKHVFAHPGMYKVCLTTGNANSLCLSNYCMDVQVGAASCNAKFTYYIDSTTNNIYFNNASIGNINNYQWQFGDGQTSNIANPTHQYTGAGYYTVNLTVYNKETGCMSSYNEVILIGNIANDCQADFFFQADNSTKNVYFINKSIVTGASQTFWYFGDGSMSIDANPVHHFNAAGVYKVCLSVFNPANQCFNTLSKEVKIGSDSVFCFADFNFTVDNSNKSVVYTDQSQGNPSNWNWSFGDGQVSILQNPENTYTKDSVYLVKLLASNATSQSLAYKLVYVGNPNLGTLLGGFGYASNKTKNKSNSYPVEFYGAANGVPAKWLWEFGDGGKDSLSINPIHEYSATGTYNVCLTVSDPAAGLSSKGCKDVEVLGTTDIKTVELAEGLNVYPNPTHNDATITYALKSNSKVEIAVYDLMGKQVQHLMSTEQSTGSHMMRWNPELNSGVYFIRLTTNNNVINQKVVINK